MVRVNKPCQEHDVLPCLPVSWHNKPEVTTLKLPFKSFRATTKWDCNVVAIISFIPTYWVDPSVTKLRLLLHFQLYILSSRSAIGMSWESGTGRKMAGNMNFWAGWLYILLVLLCLDHDNMNTMCILPWIAAGSFLICDVSERTQLLKKSYFYIVTWCLIFSAYSTMPQLFLK